MIAPQGLALGPPQGREIGEKLLWKNEETPLKGRCHERDYTQMFYGFLIRIQKYVSLCEEYINGYIITSIFHQIFMFYNKLNFVAG